MKTVFLDSDVLLDAALKRPNFAVAAMNIMDLADRKKLKAVTSSVSFVNVHYFIDKYERANKFNLLKEIRSMLSITAIDETVIDSALKSERADFEDAVQYFAALNAGVDVIVTRNIKDYKQAAIPVLTPEQFLKTL